MEGRARKDGSDGGSCTRIIKERKLGASQTPIGRALFASYFRLDIAMSVTMGNPVFLDERWWRNDPLNQIRLTPQTPIILLADAALSHLTVSLAKLTHLKQSAEFGRRKIMSKIHDSKILQPQQKLDQQKLETRIRLQVAVIERELDGWTHCLPPWFSAMQEEPEIPTLLYSRPIESVHPFIPVILSCAYAANIQLWRIANPEEETPPTAIFAVVVKKLNLFVQLTEVADLSIIPNVWIGGLFLQRPGQRDLLEAKIRKRIEETDFFLWKFCLQGLIHGWTSDGRDKPFKFLPEDAQEIVPEVSENLWKAEGVMKLIAFEDEEYAEGRVPYRFTGDIKLFNGESDDSDEES